MKWMMRREKMRLDFLHLILSKIIGVKSLKHMKLHPLAVPGGILGREPTLHQFPRRIEHGGTHPHSFGCRLPLKSFPLETFNGLVRVVHAVTWE
jgi:hypothetical protein